MPPPWTTFVALGDSLTEGLGDPQAAGAVRGWAARFTDIVGASGPRPAFTNLAVRGYLTRDVLETQLEPALALQADLVSVMCGGNDALFGRGFDPVVLRGLLESIVAPLAATGATMLMATIPDLTVCTPWMRGPIKRHVRDRLMAVNANTVEVAEAHGAVLVDLWSDPLTHRHSTWSIDRIHPSALGHELIACRMAEALGLPTDAPDPSMPILALARRSAGELAWLARHVRRLPGSA